MYTHVRYYLISLPVPAAVECINAVVAVAKDIMQKSSTFLFILSKTGGYFCLKCYSADAL